MYLAKLVTIIAIMVCGMVAGCNQQFIATPAVLINNQPMPLDPSLYGPLSDKLEFRLPDGYPTVVANQAFSVVVSHAEAINAQLFPFDGINPSPTDPTVWKGNSRGNFLSPHADNMLGDKIDPSEGNYSILSLVPLVNLGGNRLMVNLKESVGKANSPAPWTKSDYQEPDTFTYVFEEGLPAGYYWLRVASTVPIIIVVK